MTEMAGLSHPYDPFGVKTHHLVSPFLSEVQTQSAYRQIVFAIMDTESPESRVQEPACEASAAFISPDTEP